MTKQIQLIKLYCAICQYYDSTIIANAQRLSNNFNPKFTDAECMTIYIFGIKEGYRTVKGVYDFIKNYWKGWFPDLPSYVAFNTRITNLSSSFVTLAQLVMRETNFTEGEMNFIMDSMPIVVASAKRSSTARVAADICDKGYCGSKGTYYYGVKLHLLSEKQNHTLPLPRDVVISRASEHDLSVSKDYLESWYNINVFADKAYCDDKWKNELAEHGVNLITPIKLTKGQDKLSFFAALFNEAVSSARQAIESFFSWLVEKTGINSASKVRSSCGLIAFIFARLAAAFYS